MRCWALTKNITRCKLSGAGPWPYCARHRRQPLYAFLVIAGGTVGSYLATFLPNVLDLWQEPSSSSKPIPTPLGPAVPATAKPAETPPTEATIARADDRYVPVTLESYSSKWYGSATDLQRDAVEATILGKVVVWEGKITSVSAGQSGEVKVVVRAIGDLYGNAFCNFPASDRAQFLSLNPGDQIQFTGVVTNIIASPFLDHCKLLRVRD